MDWIDTPTHPKVDQPGPQKIAEITTKVGDIRAGSAQAVPRPHNLSSVRAPSAVVQPVLNEDPRRSFGIGEVSTMLKTKSAIVAGVLADAESMATRGKSPILIGGESGTGKTCLAKQVHIWSGRPGDFVRVNCANISGSIGEAELFGHVARAFTDAREAKKGALEVADKGTLFLDEVGELTPELQKKLLDFMEEGTFHPVGGIVQTRRVDVRIICATHKDLDAMAEEGTFRKDLLYRLAKLRVEMVSLRDRREDILDIIADLCARGGYDLPARVIDALSFGSYPGNIRQLDGVLEAAHVGRWTPERATAEVTKMGTATVRALPKPARMVAEDRLSVARELSAARAESGGWWMAMELAAAADVTKRTINTDIKGWMANGEVECAGAKNSAKYRATSQHFAALRSSNNQQGGEA